MSEDIEFPARYHPEEAFWIVEDEKWGES